MWKFKVLIQFILSHLPKGEKINFLFQKFLKTHSSLEKEKRIIKLIEKLKFIDNYLKIENSVVLEIGTGWDAINPILFYLMGAKTVYSFDHVAHARFELVQQILKTIENRMEEIQTITSISKSLLLKRLLKLKKAQNLKQLFSLSNIVYKAPGNAANTGLPKNSVDLVYSYAVLEHVPESVIHELILEAKRVLKKDGIVYNAIGLHDHYTSVDKKISKVNFLKYPEWLWKFFVKNKISYHNRLREKQFLEIFKSHGGKIIDIKNKVDPADLEILKMMKINKVFSGMTREELAVNYSEIMMSF